VRARPNLLEPAAVIATALAFLLFAHVLGLHGVFIAVSGIAWGTYVTVRVRRDRGIVREWGFGRDGLRPTLLATTLLAAAALPAMALVGVARGTLTLNGHLLLLLLLYPAWGLGQQFLFQALVAGNLRRTAMPAWAVVLVTAVLFGLIHAPDPELVLATFALGLLFTPLYLRWRNLWPLGLWHAWLGTFFYFWVLGRDPWLDL
jgi:membrane protease YdiL (CAAX protease family)